MSKEEEINDKNTIELKLTHNDGIVESSEEQSYTMDDALTELSSISQRFQLIHSIACVVLWGVGNQFFYSIPFY